MDVLRGEKILLGKGVKVKGIVLNKVRGKRYEFRVGDVEALTDMDVIGVIPYSEKFMEALAYKLPLVEYAPKSLPALRLYKFASNLTGENIPLKLSFLDKLKILLTSKFIK